MVNTRFIFSASVLIIAALSFQGCNEKPISKDDFTDPPVEIPLTLSGALDLEPYRSCFIMGNRK